MGRDDDDGGGRAGGREEVDAEDFGSGRGSGGTIRVNDVAVPTCVL